MLRSFRQSQIENTYKLKMQISNVRSSMPIGDKDIIRNGKFAMEDNDHSNAEMHPGHEKSNAWGVPKRYCGVSMQETIPHRKNNSKFMHGPGDQ